MKSMRRIGRLLTGTLSIVALSAWSGAPIHLTPESKLWVDGTSTVRDFTCRAGRIDGRIDGAASLALQDLSGAVRSLDITIPVQSLDCNNGTMNTHMRRALKSEEFSTIEYHLDRYQVAPNGSEGAAVSMSGKLKMAGQERPITMNVTATPTDNGGLRVEGSQELDMTKYGMKPPSLMMGTMRVRDRVTVRFDVTLKP